MKLIFISFVKSAPRYRQDPSFIYRCENLALGLESIGHFSMLYHCSEVTPSILLKSDCVVLHRPRNGWRFRWILNFCRAFKKKVVCDFDDLVMDPYFAEFSPAFLNGVRKISDVRLDFEKHEKAISEFEFITVSTEELRVRVLKRWPSSCVFVLPNSVYHGWYGEKEEYNLKKTPPRVIGYMSGTRSHDRDFMECRHHLKALLDEDEGLSLHIYGEVGGGVSTLGPQVKVFPKVPFYNYKSCYEDIAVAIAPLENTPFNQCKSSLKAIEAGFFGLPTVASHNGDFERLSNSGVWLVNDSNDWKNQLTGALDASQSFEYRSWVKSRSIASSNVVERAREFSYFLTK